MALQQPVHKRNECKMILAHTKPLRIELAEKEADKEMGAPRQQASPLKGEKETTIEVAAKAEEGGTEGTRDAKEEETVMDRNDSLGHIDKSKSTMVSVC